MRAVTSRRRFAVSSYLNQGMSVHADDSRLFDLGLPGHVLVTVDHELWPIRFNVCSKSLKAVVYPVLPVVDAPRSVVRQENVNGRKRAEDSLDFLLFVQEIPTRLVPPRPSQTAELQAFVFTYVEMQVHNRVRERCVAVMITFDSIDRRTLMLLCGLEHDLVSDITARQHDVGCARAVLPVEVINVCKDQ